MILTIFLTIIFFTPIASINCPKSEGVNRIYFFDLWLSVLPVIYHSEYDTGAVAEPTSRYNNTFIKSFEEDMHIACCHLSSVQISSNQLQGHVDYTVCKLSERHYCDGECFPLPGIKSRTDLLSLSLAISRRIRKKMTCTSAHCLTL